MELTEPLVPEKFVQQVMNLEATIAHYSRDAAEYASDVVACSKASLCSLMEHPEVKAAHRASARALEELNRVVIKHALMAGRA